MSRSLILLLLCSCASADPRPPAGRLAFAALKGDLDGVRALLAQSADPNDRLGEIDPPLRLGGSVDWSALHAAGHGGHVEILKLLIRAGADLKVDDGYGATPLDQALRNKEHGEEMALLLIESGAPVNTRVGVYIDDYGDGGSTALHSAAGWGWRRVVQAMLRRNVYVHPRTTGKWTPLFCAEDSEVIRMLLAAGAGLEARDRSDMTPLAFAIVRDRDAAAIAFLKAGANPNVTWDNGYYPLDEALDLKRLPLLRALLEAGADLNRRNTYGHSALQRTARMFGPEAEEFALQLLSKGADWKGGKDRWDIPLIAAAMTGHAKLVAALLDRGADIHQTEEDGSTALHVACDAAQEEVVRLLVKRGANIRLKNKEGETPLDAAKEQKIHDILTGNQ